jgi:hypothetical protein
MRLHGNAALSWQGRRRLALRVVGGGWTVTAAAEAAGVSVRSARNWDPDPAGAGPPRPGRARASGPVRALAPGRARPHRRQTAGPDRGRRRQTRNRRDQAQPGQAPDRRGWRRAQNHRLGVRPRLRRRLQPARLCRSTPDEKATTAVGFLRRAVAFYRRHGILVE